MEIKSKGIYIVIEESAIGYHKKVMKIEVLELTEITILYQNLDSESKYKARETIEEFTSKWKLLESLPSTTLKGFHTA